MSEVVSKNKGNGRKGLDKTECGGNGGLHERLTMLEEEVRSIRKMLDDVQLLRALNAQRIVKLEAVLNEREGKERRDYNILAHKIVDHLGDKILGGGNPSRANLEYKEIMGFLHLKHDNEAYRVMRKATELYNDKVAINNGGKRKMRLVPRRRFIEEVVENGRIVW